MQHQQSISMFEQAKKVIPGGVNSPVRAFNAVGGQPLFIDHAKGSKVYDADGNGFIDYVGSWGPMILGHCHPKVVEAIQKTAAKGASFGAPTESEIELAELVCSAIPNVDKVRMVSSGTEATMSAIRLARGATGRDKILKFEGCYHGHSDSLLVKAGSGLATLGEPTSPGVPADFARHTLTALYNDLSSVKALTDEYGSELACIIVEPIAGNMGCIPPQAGFLEGLRYICNQHGILLIMDEVMTGFRVGYGGAQKHFGVYGDLVTFGKIIGGGLPVGAFGGRADLMDQLSPDGSIYQAGTLSGNPLAMSAGIATLKLIGEEGFYDQIEEKSAYLEKGLREAASVASVATCLQRVGGMFCLYFNEGPVTDFATALNSDNDVFGRYFHGMLNEGIYLGPAQLESGFMSGAHSIEDLDRTIEAAHKVLSQL